MTDMFAPTNESNFSIGTFFESVVKSGSEAFKAYEEGKAKVEIAKTAAASPQANLISMGLIALIIIAAMFFIMKKV